MFTKRIFVLAFLFFTVSLNTGCPRDIANSVAESSNLTKEYNEKVDAANALEADLSRNHHIYITLGSMSKSLTSMNWAAVSEADRVTIRNKLNQYLSLIGRIIELSNHKALKDQVASSSRSTQRDHQQSAADYLENLNKFEKK